MKDKLNMYYQARIEASKRDPLLSNRDRAAECLYVSADALSNYEHGKPYPPCDVVQRMIEVYEAHELRSAHICERCPIMTDYSPITSQLAEAALGWAISMQNTQEMALNFAAVARDGRISAEEMAQAQKIRAKAVDVKNAMEESITAIDRAMSEVNREGKR